MAPVTTTLTGGQGNDYLDDGAGFTYIIRPSVDYDTFLDTHSLGVVIFSAIEA